MTKNFQGIKNQIWWNNIKSKTAWAVCGVFTVASWTFAILANGCQKGAEWTKNYAENKATETTEMKNNAQQENERLNQEFLNGVNNETEAELTDSEVDSDLEEENFIELSK